MYFSVITHYPMLNNYVMRAYFSIVYSLGSYLMLISARHRSFIFIIKSLYMRRRNGEVIHLGDILKYN